MTDTLTPAQLELATRILTGTSDKPTFDVSALIAETRSKLGFQPIAKPGTIEVSDPAAVQALIAAADELAEQEKSAKEQRDAIKDILKAIVTDAEASTGETVEQLTVAGKKVFAYSSSTSRVLDQTAVKRLFPDIPENAELYKTQVVRRATF